MWLDMEKLMINLGLQPSAAGIERPFLDWSHEGVFACDNVEGDKAGDERDRPGRDAGARSANREGWNRKIQARKVWRRMFAWEDA